MTDMTLQIALQACHVGPLKRFEILCNRIGSPLPLILLLLLNLHNGKTEGASWQSDVFT